MLLDELEDFDENIPAEYPILDRVYEWEYESWKSGVPVQLSADYIAAYRHSDSRYNDTEESTKTICVAMYGEEYMRRNEELEDLVLSLERENEQLKMNIDAERTQHDTDILHLKQKMEKEKISAVRKLEDKIGRLEKRIEKYKLLADNLYLLEDLNKLRKESQKLRNEMFQLREDIRTGKRELNSIKKEIQNCKR
jgi:chromosome segregation ATPase